MRRQYLSILFLVLVIVISLAFSQIGYFSAVREGLVSDSEKKKIQKILSDYTEKIESLCKNTLGTTTSSGKTSINSAKLDDQTVNAISTILNNAQYTATAKVDKIIALGLNDPGLTPIINANMGARYAETVSMLQNLKGLNIKDDDTLTALIEQHLKSPVPTGASSTYDQISNYLNPSLE